MALADRDAYNTPADLPLALLTRLCPWRMVSFYLPILRVVLRSSWRASRSAYDAARWVESSSDIMQAMEGFGLRLSIDGMHNLHRFEGPAVFVANHMSTLETFVLPCIIQPVKPVTFVVKESLLHYPVFGPIMRSRDPVAVSRQNPREDLVTVLKGGEERLRRGTSLIIFPQGTRFPKVEAMQFNSLAAKLASRAGVPLVPIALQTDAWGNGRFLKDLGPIDPSRPVRFRFGAPISPAGKSNEAHEASLAFIMETLNAWDRSDRGGV